MTDSSRLCVRRSFFFTKVVRSLLYYKNTQRLFPKATHEWTVIGDSILKKKSKDITNQLFTSPTCAPGVLYSTTTACPVSTETSALPGLYLLQETNQIKKRHFNKANALKTTCAT